MSFPPADGAVGVKICGITNPADAAMCLSVGADALGFNFFPGSSRVIEPDEAIPWIRELGDAAARVAVVVNPPPELLEKIREAGCFDVVQFHGDETPGFCAQSGFARWIKAVRVSGIESAQNSLAFATPDILLDGCIPGAYGGTGHRLNWDVARDFVSAHPDRHFLLAGGLSARNVRQAIRIVRPHAVDVASGVELTPRKKDEDLVLQFVREAKNRQV